MADPVNEEASDDEKSSKAEEHWTREFCCHRPDDDVPGIFRGKDSQQGTIGGEGHEFLSVLIYDIEDGWVIHGDCQPALPFYR